MKPKCWIITLAIVLVLGNAFWLYQTIDNGITMTYQGSSFELTKKMYEQTILLANMQIIGLGADEVMTKIGKDVYGLEPFEKEGCIIAGQVCIRLDENRVVTGIEGNGL